MDDAFDNDDVNAPIFLRRLDKFIQDLLLARCHVEKNPLLVAGKEEVSEKLEEFIDYMESQLPKATKEKAHKCLDWSESDPCGNPSILSSAKHIQLKPVPVDFFKIVEDILPSNPKLPKILATSPPELNPGNEDSMDTELNKEDAAPSIIGIGEVVLISSDSGPYHVLITDLVDPQSFEGTFACAYGVRLWTASDISALGFPTKGLEDLLGEDEVALSNFKDLVRPGTILGGGVFGVYGVRLVPIWWADPEALPGTELRFQYFFDYRRLTLMKLDFGLNKEPWKILQWMRNRQISCYMASNWRTWDYCVDRLYHAFNDFFLSFQSPVTQEAKLIKLSTIVERDWLLQTPISVLKTAKYSSNELGGTLAMWVQTREEAELMLGPSAHDEFPGVFPETHYVIQPKTGEPHLDRFTFCIILPMVLWISPRKEGETDVLSFKAHMQSLAPPVGGTISANGGNGAVNAKGVAQVHWNSKYIVAETIENGVMPT